MHAGTAYVLAYALALVATLVLLGGMPLSRDPHSHECAWSALHAGLTDVLCLTAAPYNLAFLGVSMCLLLCTYVCARIAEEVFPGARPEKKRA